MEDDMILTVETVQKLREDLNTLLLDKGLPVTKQIRSANVVKDKLLKKFENYVLPWKTMSEHSQYVRVMIKEKSDEAVERRALCAQNNLPYETCQADYFRKSDKYFVRDTDFITRGYDFDLEDFNPRPLEYQSEVKLADFSSIIEKYGDSGMVSLAGSLLSLLEESQRRGLSSPQLAELLFQFVKENVPGLVGPSYLYYKSFDARSIYKLLVLEVDLTKEKDMVEAAKAKVTRSVGQHISEPLNALKSLSYQLLRIVSDKTINQMESVSGKLALQDSKYFVTPGITDKYRKWLYSKISTGETITFQEGVRKLSDLENSNPTLKITSMMTNKVATTDPQSLMGDIHNIERGRGTDRRPERRGRSWNRSPSYRRNTSNDRRGRAFSPGRNRDFRPRRDERRQGRDSRRDRNSGRGFSDRRRSYSRDERRSSFSRQPSDRQRSFSSTREDRNRREGSYNRNRPVSPWSRPSSASPSASASRESSRSSSMDRRDKYTGSMNSFGNDNSRYDKRPFNNNQASLKDPRDLNLCMRCGSQAHDGKNCHRYRSFRKTGFCGICAKVKDLKLKHFESHCNFARDSKYRSPSTETRERRVTQIDRRQKN